MYRAVQQEFRTGVEESFLLHLNQAAAGAHQDSAKLFAQGRHRVGDEIGAAAWYQVDNLLRPADMRSHDVAVRLVEHLPQAILSLLKVAKKPLVPALLPLHDDRGVHRT